MNTKSDIVERNILLTEKIMHYLLENPQIFESLPDDFELIILPENDSEMYMYNLSLLDKFGSEGKEVVFARLGKNAEESEPSLFAPVAI